MNQHEKDKSFDEFAPLAIEKEIIRSREYPYKDINFRYSFIMDFLVLELVCLSLSILLLGIHNIYGEETLRNFFWKYYYLVIIQSFILIAEIILVYIYFKEIITYGKRWLINLLYLIFVFIFATIIVFSSFNSGITVIFIEALFCQNILLLIIMNTFSILEDKNLIKLFVIYLFTFILIIIYFIVVKEKYIIFFILATASVLYFSYLLNYYKRQLIFRFPAYFGVEKIKRKITNINNPENYGNFNIDSESEIDKIEEEKIYQKEKEIVEKLPLACLTKLSFISSFADTTVFNFS
jgi:hypothetical protein